MNTKFLLLALCVAALSSCSTAYKMGQTPDDVYFSPARERGEYVEADQNEERYLSQDRREDRYSNRRSNSNEDYYAYQNDRLLRMSIGNRMRLSAYDDFYWNDGYYGYNNWKYNLQSYNSFNNPWNSYYYWNNFYNPYSRFNYINPFYYNPYYGGVVSGNPKGPINNTSRPRVFNPNSYSNNNQYLDRNNAGTNNRPLNANSGGRYNNRNTYYNNRNNNENSTLGNSFKRVFSAPENNNTYSNSNQNSNNSYTPSRSNDAPVRTYTPSSSSSSSSGSGGSSGGGGISRPSRSGQ